MPEKDPDPEPEAHGQSKIQAPPVTRPRSDLPEPPAQRFGDYELLEEIARGGMGIVYRARQLSLQRLVAIKLLPFSSLTSAEHLKRFSAEASAAAVLHHPNIVAVHEVGVLQGQHYLVMNLVHGPPLNQLVASGPLPAKRAARYVKVIAQAVHYAHEKGILHRDLKPSNVLIDENDQPQVTDFGLAKRLDGESSLTLTGQALGSPGYMPPEQALAEHGKVTRRSDVYGLGAILYHLLTGRPPFQASTINQAIQQAAEQEPLAPQLLNPNVTRDLQTICLKCLEKETERRYQTAQDVADELERFLNGEPIQARPVGALRKAWRWCRRRPVLAGLSLALMLTSAAGLAGVLWQWRRAVNAQRAVEQERDRAEANLYAADMLLAQQAWEQSNLGRTSKLLNKHRPAPNRKDYRGWEWRYLWRLCQSDELLTLGRLSNSVLGVAFSPDGRHATTARGELRIWDLTTGQMIEPPAMESATSPVVCVGSVAYSSDGELLAYGTAHQGVNVWSTLDHRHVAGFPVQQPFLHGTRLAFVPNQHVLAAGDDSGLITLWDLETKTRIGAFVGHDASISWLAFDPAGRTLASADRAGMVKLWDTTTRKELPAPTSGISKALTVEFAPNGRLLASGGWDGTVRAWSIPDLRQLAARTNHTSWVSSLAFSSDGRTLASAAADQTIRLWDTTTWEEIRTLRGHQDEVQAIDFSPDGKRLLSGAKDGEIKVWSATVERHEPDVRPIPMSAVFQVLAPDGSALALFHTNQTVSVWTLPELKESTHFPISDAMESVLAVEISSAGRYVAYSLSNGRVKLWETGTGSLITQTPVGGEAYRALRFSFDGKLLVGGGVGTEIILWDAETLDQTDLLSRSAPGPIQVMAFSWDDRSLGVGKPDGIVEVWNLARQKRFRVETRCALSGIALLPDGRNLATSDLDAKLRLWDLETGQEKATFGHTLNAFFSLALSADGSRIAAGIHNGPVGLWDVNTGQEIATLGRTGTVHSLAFLPDGSGLVALGDTSIKNNSINVWRAPSWQEIAAKEDSTSLR